MDASLDTAVHAWLTLVKRWLLTLTCDTGSQPYSGKQVDINRPEVLPLATLPECLPSLIAYSKLMKQ